MSRLPALTEKQFAQQVIGLARALGYREWRTWNSLHSPKGWPDLALARKCDCGIAAHLGVPLEDLDRGDHEMLCKQRFVLAELKTDAKASKLSPDQVESIAWLQAAGVEVHVWRPADFDEIAAVLR